jgi:ribonuclease VapC
VILDTSAVIAILADEAEGHQFREVISTASLVRISAAGYLEAAIVLDSRSGPRGLSPELDLFVSWARATVEPISSAQARIARQAHRDYGRGSGHPARLNFGDCFSYALSKDTGEPLLFKGDDFSRTDVVPAI